MAKVSGPFLSVSASGTVGQIVTASRWKGIQYMREWFKPQNPRTEQQIIVRNRMIKAVASYHQESAETKAAWDEAAYGQPISGFNLYVKRYIEYMRDNNEQEPTRPFLP